MFKEFRKECQDVLNIAYKDEIKDATAKIPEASWAIPRVETFGDLSTNICFVLAPLFKKSPEEIANTLVGKIKPKKLLKEVKAEKGYLNFFINYHPFILKLLENVDRDFGRGSKKLEKIIVEHTSANPDGPLHIGHLRNAVIGDTLSRILRFAGYDVDVHYYLNDMGKQTAKVVWGRRKFDVMDGKKDHSTAEIYIEANRVIEEQGLDFELSELLSKYEAGEKKTVDEFVSAVEFCLEGIKETLGRLGIKHDRFVWESTFVRDGSVGKIIDRLAKTKYAERDGGALILDLLDFDIDKQMVIVRGDGTSLYIARDLAHHAWKMKEGTGINVWGADHKLVSMQLSVGLKILGFQAPEFIIHEFISLPQGSMSTRKGVFISADQLIDETVTKAFEELRSRRPEIGEEAAREIAEDIGISAVRFNIERIAPEKSMVFKWEEALDFERQGAPFIQYAYARAKKILSKADETKREMETDYIEDEEKRLFRVVSRFPEIVEEAALSRKASIVAGYVIDISNAFHSFYMSSRVLGAEKEGFRLSLVDAFTTVIGNVMDILGISRLDEM
jgi:arginyl-tRNA synthetase